MIDLRKTTGLLITFLVIALSGFPIFVGELSFIISFIFLLAYTLYLKKNPLRGKFTLLIIFFLLVALAQFLTFGAYNLYGFLGYLTRIGIAFLAVVILKEQIVFNYIKVLKFLAIVSFVVFLPSYLNQNIATILNSFAVATFPVGETQFGREIVEGSLGLYHFNRHFLESVRNSGPFWEPGAFGGYLMLAVIFNTFLKKKLFDRTNIILLIGVISTFSTTAYIACFLFLLGYSTYKSKKVSYLVYTVIGLFIASMLYQQLPFLQEKINQQFSTYRETAYERGGDTRFGAAYLDLIEFADSPIYGRGIGQGNRKVYGGDFARRHNGLTGFLNSWGGIIFLVYWLYTFRGIKRLDKNKILAFLGVATWATLNFSEVYFNHPVFWVLCCIGLMNLNFSTDNEGTNK